MTVLAFSLAVLLAGSLIYSLLVVVGSRHYLRQPQGQTDAPPISILKPLAGWDLGLEENLRSFFEQDYPEFEILFAVRYAGDPAAEVVEKLRDEYHVPVRLIVTGDPPYPNAKVFSLQCMLAEARHGLLVMSDSDIRAPRDLLSQVAFEFQDPSVALATCPYRAVAGPSIWSRLEAAGMNTEFFGGLLVARLVDGVKFAVGPTIAARREVLNAVGGFKRLKDYLAEDFVLGRKAAEKGFGVILSRAIIEHRIGSETFRANAAHRVRWARSTRRSRPAGYVGQVFTNPLPLAVLLTMAAPVFWPVLPITLVIRAIAAQAQAQILRDRVPWHLLPLQDLLSFAFWIAGFFGNTVLWRGRRYILHSDGRFEPTQP